MGGTWSVLDNKAPVRDHVCLHVVLDKHLVLTFCDKGAETIYEDTTQISSSTRTQVQSLKLTKPKNDDGLNKRLYPDAQMISSMQMEMKEVLTNLSC